jgi:MYXO-CTERM domain-containing protein
VGGRWDTDTDDNAEWYATMEGQSVDSLQLQLGFIWYELSTFPSYGLADLQATTNVTDATVVFETDFEGCGECDQSTRITYAEEALTAFGADGGGGGAGEDAGNSDGVGTPCTVTATGQSGTCLETSTCAAKGGVSTADYCPGPTNVQCCTGLSDAAARPPKEDAAAPEEPDAATRDAAAAHDAATTHAMTHGESHDASGGDAGDLAPTQAGCGCRMTPRMPRGEGVLLLAIASIAARRRRRR